MTIQKRMSYYARRLGRRICQRSSAPLQNRLRGLANTFLFGLENVNFDMHSNGEARVVEVFVSFEDSPSVFDVGANVGEWSKLVLQRMPSCSLNAFEIVPETAALLETNLAPYSQRASINRIGLSDSNGTVNIWQKRSTGGDSTAFPITGFKHHDDKYPDCIECEVVTAESFIERNTTNGVDLLKIDTEGMELKVLQGFAKHLNEVRLIQFEYGVFNISSHALLVDFFNLLEPMGFAIGKVFPKGVEFFDYHFSREDFRGNNYVAVKKDDIELMDALAGVYGRCARNQLA